MRQDEKCSLTSIRTWQVQPNNLSNYPADSVIVAAARLMISLVVTFCYPLQAHPSRTCITTIISATPLGSAL